MRFWKRNTGRSGISVSRGPAAGFPNQHRPLTERLELSAILCHQIMCEHAQADMRRQPLRVELRLNSELQVHYQGRYLNIVECRHGSPRLRQWVRPCGGPVEIDWKTSFGEPGRCPAIFALECPKPPLESFTSSRSSYGKALFGDLLSPPGF
jgi:hypothetical protein